MRHKVAVIGGGVAGAELVRVVSQGQMDFTLIEPKSRIELQALYPEYLASLAKIEEITAPLQPFCNRIGVQLLNERAIRLEDNVVICEKGEVNFDIAIIATGAAQNYFGIKGKVHTFSIATLEETIRARSFIENNNPERIMIIGSGLTGVEAACVLAESLDASIYIVEARERILPQFVPQTSALIEKTLARKGVSVLTSTQVKEVSEDFIVFSDGSRLDCDMAIWTAGLKPPKFLEDLGLPKNLGWIRVDKCLRASNAIFAIGDSAWVEIDGRLATKTGLEAERQANHTAKNLIRLEEGKSLERYSVRASSDSQVALISMGCDCAVGIYGKMCIGSPTRLIYSLKSWIDKSFIRRFK